MKMQMREILILSAVDDEPVGFEIVFLHEALDGGIQIREKSGIAGVEVCQCLDLSHWDDDEMKLVTW